MRCFYFRPRLSFLVSPLLSFSFSLGRFAKLLAPVAALFLVPRRSRWQAAPQRMLQVFARLGENCRPSRSRCSIAREREREEEGDGAADEAAAWVEVRHQSKKQQKTT